MFSKTFVRYPGILMISLICLLTFSFNGTAADTPQTADQIPRISVEKLLQLLEQEAVVIVDARVTRAWNRAGNKIPDAIRLDTTEKIDQFAADTDRQQAIVAYCL